MINSNCQSNICVSPLQTERCLIGLQSVMILVVTLRERLTANPFREERFGDPQFTWRLRV
jgi:hypothetical protein